jgi:trigger factor
MLKTLEDITPTKKRLSIEIPAEAFEGEIQSSLEMIRRRTKLPGFRQGKAPLGLIEKRFGKDVEGEAIEKVIPEYYTKALDEADIVPVAQPNLEGGIDFKRHAPLLLTFTVEIRPRVENLSYEGIEVEDVAVEITDQDIENTVNRLQEDKATFTPSEEPAKEGDLLVLDYSLLGGPEFKDQVFRLGNESMPELFSQKITGLKKGEDASFEMTLPDDFQDPELAGKSFTTSVTVKEVKNVTLPELDDEFAKDLELDSMETLRNSIRERLEESRREQVDNVLKGQVMKKLLDAHEFEAPESLVEQELAHWVAQAQGQGRTEDKEKLTEEFRAEAERNVRASMLVQIIGDRENIEVSEDDIRNKLVALSGKFGLSPENVMKYYVSRDGSLEGLKNSIYEEKVLALLLEKAVVKPAKGEGK